MTTEERGRALVYLRRMDNGIARMRANLGEIGTCLGRVEDGVARLGMICAGTMATMDRIDGRLERIGRRLDLQDVCP